MGEGTSNAVPRYEWKICLSVVVVVEKKTRKVAWDNKEPLARLASGRDALEQKWCKSGILALRS
jgi:hypothetical protein